MPNEKWTIAQTVQEAVSAELYQEARAARISRGRRGRFVLSPGLHGSPDPRYREFQIKDAAWRQLKSEVEGNLRNMLKAGKLSSTGRFGSVAADERAIPPSGWQHIRIIDWEKSTGREQPTGVPIFDIRISTCAVKANPTKSKAVQNVEQKLPRKERVMRTLARLMQAHPEEPCLTKAQLKKTGLSQRELQDCWAKALSRAGNPAAWEASGRRKNSWLAKLSKSDKLELGI